MDKKNFSYLLLLIGLVALNEVLFRLIGQISYVEWFIERFTNRRDQDACDPGLGFE